MARSWGDSPFYETLVASDLSEVPADTPHGTVVVVPVDAGSSDEAFAPALVYVVWKPEHQHKHEHEHEHEQLRLADEDDDA